MDATQQILDDSILESEEEEEEKEGRRGDPLAKLRVFKNVHIPETELPLYLGENVLGRDPTTCSLPLPACSVSKQHTIISIADSRGNGRRGDAATEALVWDLGSMNGTRKGRLKLTPHVRYALSEGDSLVIADIPCQYTCCSVDKMADLRDKRSPGMEESGKNDSGKKDSGKRAQVGDVKEKEDCHLRESLQRESLQSESLQRESLQSESLQRESLQSESLQRESLQRESLQRESLQRESLQSESLQSESQRPQTSTDTEANVKGGPIDKTEVVGASARPKIPSQTEPGSLGNQTSCPEQTLVPESDSDSDGERERRRKRNRTFVGLESGSHRSSPTCSTFWSPTSHVIPESPVTPYSSSAEHKPSNRVVFSEEEREADLVRQQPSIKKTRVIADDSKEQREAEERERRRASPGRQAVQPIASGEPDVSAEPSNDVGVSTGGGSARGVSDGVWLELNMDSDTDVEEEGARGPAGIEVPVTLNGAASPLAHLDTDPEQFHMDSDTDLEDDETSGNVSVPKLASDGRRSPDRAPVARRSDICQDSDTDVEEQDVTSMSHQADAPADRLSPAQPMEFHLDSDTDVEDEEDMESRKRDSTSGTEEMHSGTAPDSKSSAAAFELRSDSEEENLDVASSKPADFATDAKPLTALDPRAEDLEILSDSDQEEDAAIFCTATNPVSSSTPPPLARIPSAALATAGVTTTTAHPEGPPAPAEGLSAPAEGPPAPAEGIADPADFRMDSDTDLEDEEAGLEDAGAMLIRSLPREKPPEGTTISAPPQTCSTAPASTVEEMETQAFHSSPHPFRQPFPPALRPVFSSCSDSQEDDDFVVAETQSFVLEGRNHPSSLLEDPTSLDATQAYDLDPSTRGEQEDLGSCHGSFQLGLSNSNLQAHRPSIASTQPHIPTRVDVELENTQAYGTTTSQGRAFLEGDSDQEATQLYGGGRREPSQRLGRKRQEDFALDATQAYISLPCEGGGREGEEEESTNVVAAETLPIPDDDEDDDDDDEKTQALELPAATAAAEATPTSACEEEEDLPEPESSVALRRGRSRGQTEKKDKEEATQPGQGTTQQCLRDDDEEEGEKEEEEEEAGIGALRRRRARPLEEEEESQPTTSSVFLSAETQPMSSLDAEDEEEEEEEASKRSAAKARGRPQKAKEAKAGRSGVSSRPVRGRMTRGKKEEEELEDCSSQPPESPTREKKKKAVKTVRTRRGNAGTREEESEEELDELPRRGRGRRSGKPRKQETEERERLEREQREREEMIEEGERKERAEEDRLRKEKEEMGRMEAGKKERMEREMRELEEREKLKREEQERRKQEEVEEAERLEKMRKEEAERLKREEEAERSRQEKEEREEKERLEQERGAKEEKARLEKMRKEEEEAERLRQEKEKEAERLRQEKEKEAERLRQKKEKEAERLKQEETEKAERLEKMRKEEAERLKQEEEAERLRQEREEREKKERLEQERAEKEQKARLMEEEKKRLERERLELQLEREEKERMEKIKENEEQERVEQQRLEKERMERELEEKQRMEREVEEKQRIEREVEEKQRIEREVEEKQRIEREVEEKQRLEKEREEKLEMEKKEKDEREERKRQEETEKERERSKEKERRDKEKAMAVKKQKLTETEDANMASTRTRRTGRRTAADPPTAEPEPAVPPSAGRTSRRTAANPPTAEPEPAVPPSAGRTSRRTAANPPTAEPQPAVPPSAGRTSRRTAANPPTAEPQPAVPPSANRTRRRTVANPPTGEPPEPVVPPSADVRRTRSRSTSVSSEQSTSSTPTQETREGGRGKAGRNSSPPASADPHQPGGVSKRRKTLAATAEVKAKDVLSADVPAGRTRSRSSSTNSLSSEISTCSVASQDRGRGGGPGRKTGSTAQPEQDSHLPLSSLDNQASAPKPTARQGRSRRAEESQEASSGVSSQPSQKAESQEPGSTRGRQRVKDKDQAPPAASAKEVQVSQEAAGASRDLQSSLCEARTSTVKMSRKRAAPVDSPSAKAARLSSLSPASSQASPASARRSRSAGLTVKVLFTGVVDEEGERVVSRLGGSMARGVADMTHLVTDKVRRTVKFLCAVAKGVPVVTPDWLDKSGKAGSFLCPDDFLVKDAEQEHKFSFCLQDSLRAASQQHLLQGYEIHVTRSVRPDPGQMKDIISCSGAHFLPKMPSAHKAQTVVVSCEEDQALCGPAFSASLPVLSAEFLLTGVLQQRVDLQAHTLPTFTKPQARGRGRGRKAS